MHFDAFCMGHDLFGRMLSKALQPTNVVEKYSQDLGYVPSPHAQGTKNKQSLSGTDYQEGTPRAKPIQN